MNDSTELIKGESALEIAKLITKYTPALYIERKPNLFKPEGSAICFRYEDNHFLVTAGHILKKNKVGVISGKKFFRLSGEYILTSPGNYHGDKIDIGIYKLDSEFVKNTKNEYLYYDLHGFNPDYKDSERMTYLLVGHPVSRIKFKPDTREIVMHPFIFMSDLNQNKNLFDNSKFGTDTHQFLNYRPRRIYDYLKGKPVQGPNPKGTSGCGIWRIENITRDKLQALSFYPTSLVIEHIADYSVLVGTRVSCVTEIIIKGFNINIITSKRVRLNLIHQNNADIII